MVWLTEARTLMPCIIEVNKVWTELRWLVRNRYEWRNLVRAHASQEAGRGYWCSLHGPPLNSQRTLDEISLFLGVKTSYLKRPLACRKWISSLCYVTNWRRQERNNETRAYHVLGCLSWVPVYKRHPLFWSDLYLELQTSKVQEKFLEFHPCAANLQH